jgi:hypothetical protein
MQFSFLFPLGIPSANETKFISFPKSDDYKLKTNAISCNVSNGDSMKSGYHPIGN